LLDSALLHHIDLPLPSAVLHYPTMRIQGWAAYPRDMSLERVAVRTSAGPHTLGFEERPDVEATVPGRSCKGFAGRVDPRTIKDPATIEYCFADGTVVERSFEFEISTEAMAWFEEAKRLKLEWIAWFLRCPACGTRPIVHESRVDCPGCGAAYRQDPYAFDFLDETFRSRGNIFDVDAVSSHDYDTDVLELIASVGDGLVLDNGSGLRSLYYPNVINFDVVAYHSTDVVGISENLPFQDATFEAVISVAALEHVRDPFAAAKEIERVLKPGGRVYVAVPFLQPFHGYPNHYYNMTSNGLRNLFEGIVDARVSVPAAGLPIWALSWILNAWAGGLPAAARQRFLKRSVADLMADPMKLMQESFVRELSAEVNEQIACLNVLQGTKGPAGP
jgi:hypothetical protein